jgi:hypothetical protein
MNKREAEPMEFTISDVFTVEEINLMCIYDTADKDRLIAEIRESARDVYEPEMLDIMRAVIMKLGHLTGEEYADIGFFPADGYDGMGD